MSRHPGNGYWTWPNSVFPPVAFLLGFRLRLSVAQYGWKLFSDRQKTFSMQKKNLLFINRRCKQKPYVKVRNH